VRDLGEIVDAALALAAGDLSRRAPVPDGGDAAVVAEALNALADRLEETLEALARGEERLAHLAMHDSLTNLPNRSLLRDRLDQALARSDRHNSITGVLFVDLDRFKEINDSLGHEAGDTVLRRVAERVQEAVRPSDTVARLDGDQFLVLCEELASEWQAGVLGERIAACLEEPFGVAGNEFYVTASIGITLARAGDSPDKALADADSAMYRAKVKGGGRVELFDERFRARTAARLRTQSDLRRALERIEFRLVYQPIVSIADGTVAGAEALLRWEHPQRGTVSPADFIPQAEESGVIVPIGSWVMAEAFRQARSWSAADPLGAAPFVSVNLSARQLLVPDLVERVRSSIADSGIDPDAVHLEITETVLMQDVELSVHTLAGLKSLGVHFAVDDFGTGYSSLSYLKRFPLDTIKVDRSFIDGLGTNPDDSSIVAAIVGLGRALGLTVLTEGVETALQLDELHALGCDLAQGYHFDRPLSAGKLVERLAARGAHAGNGHPGPPAV
jgi:diguanylate cyclase (GGDEF)-like protein